MVSQTLTLAKRAPVASPISPHNRILVPSNLAPGFGNRPGKALILPRFPQVNNITSTQSASCSQRQQIRCSPRIACLAAFLGCRRHRLVRPSIHQLILHRRDVVRSFHLTPAVFSPGCRAPFFAGAGKRHAFACPKLERSRVLSEDKILQGWNETLWQKATFLK